MHHESFFETSCGALVRRRGFEEDVFHLPEQAFPGILPQVPFGDCRRAERRPRRGSCTYHDKGLLLPSDRNVGGFKGDASPGVVPMLWQGPPQARVPGRVHLLGRCAAVGFQRRGQVPHRPGAVVHQSLRVQGHARLLLLPHGDAARRLGALPRAFPEGEHPSRGREEGCQGQFPAGMEHPPAVVQDFQGGARCAPPGL